MYLIESEIADLQSDYKSKWKKLEDIDPKYLPPHQKGPDGQDVPWSDDPATIRWLVETVLARKANEKRILQEAKQQAIDQKEQKLRMEQLEKRQKEERERQREYQRTLPQRQFEMLVSEIELTVAITATNTHNMKAAIRPFSKIYRKKKQNLFLDKGYDFWEIENEVT